jgi:hypothetical protein
MGTPGGGTQVRSEGTDQHTCLRGSLVSSTGRRKHLKPRPMMARSRSLCESVDTARCVHTAHKTWTWKILLESHRPSPQRALSQRPSQFPSPVRHKQEKVPTRIGDSDSVGESLNLASLALHFMPREQVSKIDRREFPRLQL